MKKILLVLSAFLCIGKAYANIRDADAILERAEKNQVFDGLSADGTIEVKDVFGTRKSTFRMSSKGRDQSLLEFTSAAERGQKVLRVRNRIYLYYPDAEEVITLNQSMFKRSFLDSDISYDDIAGDKSYKERYTAVLEGRETVGGESCYVLFLTAKNFREVSYGYQKVWISEKHFSLKKAEMYTRSKKLHKTLVVHEEEIIEGIALATDVEFRDMFAEHSGTRIRLTTIVLAQVDEKQFSIERLKF